MKLDSKTNLYYIKNTLFNKPQNYSKIGPFCAFLHNYYLFNIGLKARSNIHCIILFQRVLLEFMNFTFVFHLISVSFAV